MERETQNLPYTICFIKIGDQVLMVHRKKRPNKDKWNGLGGKIEDGETAHESVIREIREEAELDLTSAQKVSYSGVVLWATREGDKEIVNSGMHTFIAEYNDNSLIFGTRETREGKLEWKPLSWVLDQNNEDVVSNIPIFLSQMLEVNEIQEHLFVYEGRNIVRHEVRSLI